MNFRRYTHTNRSTEQTKNQKIDKTDMFFFSVDKKRKETFKMDIFRKERRKKKHTPGDYKVLFSCVRVQKEKG